MRPVPLPTLRLLCVLLLVAPVPAGAQNADVDPLRQRMGEATFRDAGLDHLSAAQLAVLERWLATHPNAMVDAVPASTMPTASAVSHSSSPKAAVDSRIAGSFVGWHKGTVLTLENGQRWQVSDDSTLATGHAIERPGVQVTRALFGGWWLQVDGYNTRARVRPAN
ncbi:hypothetical protein ISP17_08265 [Dyella ginsengisoli]|uniref:Secreted protein n=1 Tax=Dyella ginsengisoli TaxID=363848 RepID=A0ABW8JUQ7_9GAMM